MEDGAITRGKSWIDPAAHEQFPQDWSDRDSIADQTRWVGTNRESQLVAPSREHQPAPLQSHDTLMTMGILGGGIFAALSCSGTSLIPAVGPGMAVSAVPLCGVLGAASGAKVAAALGQLMDGRSWSEFDIERINSAELSTLVSTGIGALMPQVFGGSLLAQSLKMAGVGGSGGRLSAGALKAIRMHEAGASGWASLKAGASEAADPMAFLNDGGMALGARLVAKSLLPAALGYVSRKLNPDAALKRLVANYQPPEGWVRSTPKATEPTVGTRLYGAMAKETDAIGPGLPTIPGLRDGTLVRDLRHEVKFQRTLHGYEAEAGTAINTRYEVFANKIGRPAPPEGTPPSGVVMRSTPLQIETQHVMLNVGERQPLYSSFRNADGKPVLMGGGKTSEAFTASILDVLDQKAEGVALLPRYRVVLPAKLGPYPPSAMPHIPGKTFTTDAGRWLFGTNYEMVMSNLKTLFEENPSIPRRDAVTRAFRNSPAGAQAESLGYNGKVHLDVRAGMISGWVGRTD